MAIEMDLGQRGRIIVRFPYNREDVDAIKTVPGRNFMKSEKAWSIPRSMEACRMMREVFGSRLSVSAALAQWAREAVEEEKARKELTQATDAEVKNLSSVAPKLNDTLRDYQRVATSFINFGRRVILADQPGLGKTLELIAGALEAFPQGGKFLVSAPKTSLFSVWGDELRFWQGYPVFVATEQGNSRAKRTRVLEEFLQHDGPAWLIVNPAMLSYERTYEPCAKHEDASAKEKQKCAKKEEGCVVDVQPVYPQLFSLVWDAIAIDECHKDAIRNKGNLSRLGMEKLRTHDNSILAAISGTPLRNKLSDLWGILNWLDPKRFSSKWQFMEQYSESRRNRFTPSGIEFTGRLREDRQEEFFGLMDQFMLRRTKEEVAKELPPKQFVDVWCEMTPFQEKQYREWEEEAEVAFDNDEIIVGIGPLDMLTRSKQFATAPHFYEDDTLVPDMKNSGKMESLLERLAERGIDKDDAEQAPGPDREKAIIFSQWARIVYGAQKVLEDEGLSTVALTGKTSQKERDRIVAEFQRDEGPQVLLMTTNAGGTAITLDRANSVHFLDETWLPDETEQASDRAHRVSRTKRTLEPVMVYCYRTRGTVEEDIKEDVAAKAGLQKLVLDERRSRFGEE